MAEAEAGREHRAGATHGGSQVARREGRVHPGRIRLDASRLVAARQLRGLSRAALVDAAEPGFPISEATVKRAEKGLAINLEKAGTLARLLGVSLASLLPDTGPDAEAPAISARAAASARAEPTAERPALVGRRDEVKRLEGLLAGCCEGRPAVAWLEGPAGIGKSRLLREAARSFRRRGGVVCQGQGYEDLRLPYHGLVEALAPQLDRLLPAGGEAAKVLEGLASPAGPSGAWSDQALVRAVSQALLGGDRPVLLVLDDLQWLDRGSLDLLEGVVAAASGAQQRGEPARFALLGGRRDGEGDARLEAALGRMGRDLAGTRVPLEPLGEAETFELVAGLGVERPAAGLVSVLREATGGNPLFVSEVLEVLRLRGELEERGGFQTSCVPAGELELPASLTSAISARADALSSPCRALLARAAFLGGQFELAKLAAVQDADEDEVLEALEEAVYAGFLENREQRFTFAHPLVRHVFYREPIPARRQRIHREIAERLERRGEAERNVCEIADHLIRAGSVAATGRLLRAAREAADRAYATFAWEDAARFCEAALAEGRRRGALSDRDVAELHLKTAVALHRCWDAGPSLEHYDEAVAAFERAGDPVGVARALNDRVRMADNLGHAPEDTRGDELERVAQRLEPGHARLRGQILDTLAGVHRSARRPERARELAREALTIGERAGDDDLCAQVSTALALSHLERLELHEARDRWAQGAAYARRAGTDPLREGRCLQRLTLPLLLLGRLGEAERVAAEALEAGRDVPNPGEVALPRAVQAAVALLRGDLAAAERRAREAVSLVERRRYVWAGPLAFPTLACVLALRGDAGEAERVVDRLATPGVVFDDASRLGSFARRLRWIVTATAGPAEGLLEVARGFAAARRAPPDPARMDFSVVSRLCIEVELADRLGRAELALPVEDALRSARERGLLACTGWPLGVERSLALCARLAGRLDEADERIEAACAWAEGEGAALEAARCRLDRARVLRARGRAGDATRARELAARARDELAALGAGALARRAAEAEPDV